MGPHQSLILLCADAFLGRRAPLDTRRSHVPAYLLVATLAVHLGLIRPDLVFCRTPDALDHFGIRVPYFTASWTTFL